MIYALHARRMTLYPPFHFVPQVQVDGERVRAIVQHMQAGGKVPPVVLVLYAGHVMALDGHHRVVASCLAGLPVDAWTVPGDQFEELDIQARDDGRARAEAWIQCDGVPAMQVASLGVN